MLAAKDISCFRTKLEKLWNLYGKAQFLVAQSSEMIYFKQMLDFIFKWQLLIYFYVVRVRKLYQNKMNVSTLK